VLGVTVEIRTTGSATDSGTLLWTGIESWACLYSCDFDALTLHFESACYVVSVAARQNVVVAQVPSRMFVDILLVGVSFV